MRGRQPQNCIGGPPIQSSSSHPCNRSIVISQTHHGIYTELDVSAGRRYERGNRTQWCLALAPQISASVLAASQYRGSSDITPEQCTMDALTSRSGMDTSSVEAFTRNGPSRRWTITHGRIVVVTLAGLYYAGQGRVVAVTCRDPILVRITLLESSPAIEGIKLPFPERGLELLSDCVGEELTWEAKYLRPYASMISDTDCGIGGPPILVLEDSKPIEQFLTLRERMEVALLVSDDAGMRCAGIGVIDECSPRGVWCGFLVPQSFFVVVIVTKVSTECQGQNAYYEE